MRSVTPWWVRFEHRVKAAARCPCARFANAMAGAAQDNDEEITGINVTPLVDIVLVLLIIFMVTANFIVRETVEVDLPRAAHGGETVQGLVNVVIDKDGQIFFDGAAVTEDQ